MIYPYNINSIKITSAITPERKMIQEQSIRLYLKGQISAEQAKSDISKRVQKIKQKIDLIEMEQKKNNKLSIQTYGSSLQSQKNSQIQVHKFVKTFKKDLKFVLSQFELFKEVIGKLQKQIYQKHELSKQILIKNIRVQMRRFHSIIPHQLQEDIQKSKIRGVSGRSAHNGSVGSVGSEIVDSDKEQFTKTEQIIQLVQKSKQQKINTNTDQNSVQQNIKILDQIRDFLLFEEQTPRPPQDQQETEQQKQKSMHISEIVAPEQYEQQQKQERKRYFTFIQKQRLRAQNSPAKIAGKILLVILIVGIIVLMLGCYFVYRVVKGLAGEL